MKGSTKTAHPSGAVNYIEDVFSTYLYTGDGSAQTINNGIDLAGKGGLVWTKRRNAAFSNELFDTVRGNFGLESNNASGQYGIGTGGFVPNSSGYTWGVTDSAWNGNGGTYASWTFRKQPKFFDIVTYTGDGNLNRQISHSLGSAPGCVIIKRTNSTSDWGVWHCGNGGSTDLTGLTLNATNSATYTNVGFSSSFTSTTFKPFNVYTAGGANYFNISGGTYVAYLFAHNAGGFGANGTDNVISCGSFTTDASGNATVNLGYEPQWILWKESSGASNWYIQDTARGLLADKGNDVALAANSSAAEITGSNTASISSTGFSFTFEASQTYIYIAIRRPMKVPTDATKVFGLSANTPVMYRNVGGTGNPVDLCIYRNDRNNSTAQQKWWFADRLRGLAPNPVSLPVLDSSSTAAETTPTYGTIPYLDGYDTSFIALQTAETDIVNYAFARATSFFDVVCYTGTGVAMTVNHNLGVAPEFIIVKGRTTASSWMVYHSYLTPNGGAYLNSNSAGSASGWSAWNSTAPTASVFSAGLGGGVNASGVTYISYLFATCPGVSKVGSYTGNGSSQTINCGFTGGARFILIKRTDSTGDWYVWDSARGIFAANDPHLSLNTTAAEVTTDDSIDPDSTGFIVNQVAATNINVTSATYIFLAVA